MSNLTLRGIPDQLHIDLKSAAEKNHRSLNGEILARLTASVRSAQLDVDALLQRIRQRNASLGEIDLSDATLREMRDAGRVCSPGRSQARSS